MGVTTHGGTMPGGLTPICNECGINLCWDISREEYMETPTFWNAWVCQDCNDGQPMSRREWLRDASQPTGQHKGDE